jgi:hypothetical protein
MITLLETVAQRPFIETIGWVLLHFIWQGAIVTLAAAVILRLLAGRPAEWRYAVACGALVVMLAFPLVTFTLLGETPAPSPSATISGEEISVPLFARPEILAGAERWQLRAEAALPAVVILWAAGVLFFPSDCCPACSRSKCLRAGRPSFRPR